MSTEIISWIEERGGGTLSQLERHVSRREAWLTSVELPDGQTLEGFLRIDRNPVAGASVSLEREARICAVLHHSDVPVPAVIAWDPDRHLALFERVPGTAAIDKLDDADRQRTIMEDFIGAVARLHQLEPARLGLEDVLGTYELTPERCALDDLDSQLNQFQQFLSNYHDPLITFGVQWLRRFAPAKVSRVSLVQGDTGPVNFMFEGYRVSALVDWEWGHWGDPMEDLGNICVREFWNPSGGLTGLFRRYEAQSGIPYDPDAVRYYRVQQNVRGMIPIHAVCHSRGMKESMAWYLAYRYVGDRSTCEALAEAMDIAIEKPQLPADNDKPGHIADAALHSLERDLAPELAGDFARSRATDLGILVECLDRKQRFAADLQAQESAEIARLLGRRPVHYTDSLAQLCMAIEEGRIADEPLIQYLARRAYRDEWLYRPASSLYPERHWSPIDP